MRDELNFVSSTISTFSLVAHSSHFICATTNFYSEISGKITNILQIAKLFFAPLEKVPGYSSEGDG